ncbi:ATP-binding protein [Anaerolineales bacterium HSG6]|nr:ATP-binding protein [Anaerolineales bacterium HSG6]MDM8530388.1 ATP-binding protein [Anaerolineales bacterium HSG25]
MMFNRIYIDNYKCCVNLDIKFDSINLFLGDNGAGKSTIFEVLRKIQGLVGRGQEISELFSIKNLTQWQKTSKQHFEIELQGNRGMYKYELEIGYERSRSLAHISQEKLCFNENCLISFVDGDAQLYLDDYSEGPLYPFDWNRSAVGSLPERSDNTKLTWFKNQLKKFIIVQINPMKMESESEQEAEFLNFQSSNFIDWYRQISQNQGKAFEITDALKNVIDGFKYFELEKVSENNRLLKVQISDFQYYFHELSDGQRTLITLYALLHFSRDQNVILCIDEPENFISLPEIQPWLSTLHDFCVDGKLQSLLISHHPELINYLADSVGLWFERNQNSPVQVKAVSNNGGLTISELMARGWLNE